MIPLPPISVTKWGKCVIHSYSYTTDLWVVLPLFYSLIIYLSSRYLSYPFFRSITLSLFRSFARSIGSSLGRPVCWTESRQNKLCCFLASSHQPTTTGTSKRTVDRTIETCCDNDKVNWARFAMMPRWPPLTLNNVNCAIVAMVWRWWQWSSTPPLHSMGNGQVLFIRNDAVMIVVNQIGQVLADEMAPDKRDKRVRWDSHTFCSSIYVCLCRCLLRSG